MKIITLHCDYIRYQAVKKALKDADSEDMELHEVKEPLVVLTSIEQGDNEETVNQLIQAVEKTAKEVKATNIVLYPYAHLSSNLAKPTVALGLLKDAEIKLNKNFKHVSRAPFGYYKTFELKCKGHPLSELSKEFKNSESKVEVSAGKVVEEKYDISKLLREINKTKLDTSKLKDNDHRILSHKLDLFSFNEVAPGMIFWHDNGLYIYNKLTEMKRNLLKTHNYLEISTPQIFDSKLFKVSGHWEHYKENMFLTNYEGRQFGVKPMNCPGAMLVFRANARSYKEMPMRFAEFGLVHRQELSGVLNGAFRVIRFTQDDSHVFCRAEQIGQEITTMLSMVNHIYKELFGFEYRLELSTRPEKFMGEIKDWDFAESTLESVLKKMKMPFKINKGDGAFYGPKIDIHIKDSLGRSWQCATIQLDMQMPKRFEVSYVGEDSKDHTPIVIHCAVMGSIERFIGVLLEHTNGNLPLWLSPRQVRAISFTDRNAKACEKFVGELRQEFPGLRIDTDLTSETVQSKIRDAEMLKINHIVVIGDKEEEKKTLAVRPRGGKPAFGIKPKDFIEQLRKELIY